MLFSWYKVTGYTLIASMKSQLNEEAQREFEACLTEVAVSDARSSVHTVIAFTQQSFDAFIREKTADQTHHPHGIDLHCMIDNRG